MKKRVLSFLLLTCLFFGLALPSYAAYTADNLADKLYSGWTSSNSYPSGMSSSWYYQVKSLFHSFNSYLSTISTNSGYLKTYLPTISDRLQYQSSINTAVKAIESDTGNIYTRLATTNSNLSNIYTAVLTIDNTVDSIESNTSGINTKVGTSNSYLSSIATSNGSILSAVQSLGLDTLNEHIANIDSSTSSIATSSDAMKSTLGDISADTTNLYSAATTLVNNSQGIVGTIQGHTIYQGTGQSALNISQALGLRISNGSETKTVISMLDRLQTVLAGDDDVKIRNAFRDGYDSIASGGGASPAADAEDYNGLGAYQGTVSDFLGNDNGVSSKDLPILINNNVSDFGYGFWDFYVRGDEVQESLGGTSSFSLLSLDDADAAAPEIVTHYYADSQELLANWREVLSGD